MKTTLLFAASIVTALAVPFSQLDGHADDDVFPNTPSVTLGPWAPKLQVGPKMNAAGVNLRDSEFVRQKLAGAVFDRCELASVSFSDCDLSHASLRSTSLAGASILWCEIAGADFDDASINGLRTTIVHLSETQIRSTQSYRTKNLRNCTIGGSELNTAVLPRFKYDFRNADLSGAELESGDFRQCDFTDAFIAGLGTGDACTEGLRISRARLTFAQLASTKSYKDRRLVNVTFSNWEPLPDDGPVIEGKVDFSGFDLTGIKIFGRALPGAVYTNATIGRGVFVGGITKAQLCATRNYKEGDLSNMTLRGIDLSKLDLSRQNLSNSVFRQCDLTAANLQDAVITGVDFTVTLIANNGLTAEQIRSTWNYKIGRMATVVLPKQLADALAAEKDPGKRAPASH